MGINTKYIDKYDKAYKNLKASVQAVSFDINSKYYYQEDWMEILDMYIPGVIPNSYYISNYGKIYTSLKSPKYPSGGIMVPSINAHGYHQINLMDTNHKK